MPRSSLVAFVLAVALLVAPAAPGRAQGWPFVAVSGDGFVVDGQPYVMKGFNYFPRHYGWAAMTEWSWAEVDAELALAAALGANTIRTTVDYGYSTGHIAEAWSADDLVAFQQPTAEYIDAMRRLLAIADGHGLKVVFSLFDYMPGWAFIDRGRRGEGSVYLTALVREFADDPRIAAWSVYNEGDHVPEKFAYVTMDKVLQFYAEMASTIKSVDTQHLVTADFGRIQNAHLMQDFVDYISFHYYEDQGSMAHEIRSLRGRLLRSMPIVSGEIGSPSAGDPWASMSRHTVALGAYLDTVVHDEPLAGVLIWNLVDIDTPRTELNRQREKGDKKFGVFDADLQPKPSAQTVQRFFASDCGPGARIELRFPSAVADPVPNDNRHMQVGLQRLAFVGGDGSTLGEVTFGTLEADLVQGRGWYHNETWGQWAGDRDGRASLCLAVPSDAVAITLSAYARRPDTELQVWANGVPLGAVTLGRALADHVLPLQ